MGTELGDHRVVVDGNLIALLHAGVHPNAWALRCDVGPEGTGGRQESRRDVFGIDAQFNGMPLNAQVFLSQPKRLSPGDADLLFHEVHAGDHLRDGMLHLQARVHFQEVKVPVGIHEELHRSGAHVTATPGAIEGTSPHAVAQIVVEQRRRRFFHDLLVAALDAALPFEQVHAMAMLVAEDLDFDVAGLGDETLEEDGAIAKGALGLAHGPLGFAPQCGWVVDNAHAFSSTTRTGFDHDGEPDLGGQPFGLVEVSHFTV